MPTNYERVRLRGIHDETVYVQPGHLGRSTPYVDAHGLRLSVGDLVVLVSPAPGPHAHVFCFVVEDGTGAPYIDGHRRLCNSVTGELALGYRAVLVRLWFNMPTGFAFAGRILESIDGEDERLSDEESMNVIRSIFDMADVTTRCLSDAALATSRTTRRPSRRGNVEPREMAPSKTGFRNDRPVVLRIYTDGDTCFSTCNQVGALTKYRDDTGAPLRVGDAVEVRLIPSHPVGDSSANYFTFVYQDADTHQQYIPGIRAWCTPATGELPPGWCLHRVAGYNEVPIGAELSPVRFEYAEHFDSDYPDCAPKDYTVQLEKRLKAEREARAKVPDELASRLYETGQRGSRPCGRIGEPTKLTDRYGAALSVGDIVYSSLNSGVPNTPPVNSLSFIIRDPDGGVTADSFFLQNIPAQAADRQARAHLVRVAQYSEVPNGLVLNGIKARICPGGSGVWDAPGMSEEESAAFLRGCLERAGIKLARPKAGERYFTGREPERARYINVGRRTAYRDIFERRLCVGDAVYVDGTFAFVLDRGDGTGPYIDGLLDVCDPVSGRVGGRHEVAQLVPFAEVPVGVSINGVTSHAMGERERAYEYPTQSPKEWNLLLFAKARAFGLPVSPDWLVGAGILPEDEADG